MDMVNHIQGTTSACYIVVIVSDQSKRQVEMIKDLCSNY